MRLIDADKLLTESDSEFISYRDDEGKVVSKLVREKKYYSLKEVEEAPTADAIPIDWIETQIKIISEEGATHLGWMLTRWRLEQERNRK